LPLWIVNNGNFNVNYDQVRCLFKFSAPASGVDSLARPAAFDDV
jgi:hypothetical protein